MFSYSYKDIKDFEPGKIVWDSSQYGNIELRILEKPVETYSENLKANQLKWICEALPSGEKLDYLITEGAEHYGPKLYSLPVYTFFQP